MTAADEKPARTRIERDALAALKALEGAVALVESMSEDPVLRMAQRVRLKVMAEVLDGQRPALRRLVHPKDLGRP